MQKLQSLIVDLKSLSKTKLFSLFILAKVEAILERKASHICYLLISAIVHSVKYE